MTLTEAEKSAYWPVLQSSPLVQKWPDFKERVLPNLDLRTYAAGEYIFHRGDPPAYLFIVASGRVVMRLTEGGETWYEQEILPGQFFGQHGLFDEVYRSAARASLRSGQPTTLLLMRASDLRESLEREPSLREDLLHETRSGRLRRIPLFRSLTDDQMHWLAGLVEEVSLAAGQALALPQRPGIWIVEQGQMALDGPINPYPNEWEGWRITAGNYFVSPGDPGKMMRFGSNSIASSAVAHVPTNLFYLPSEHAERLINMFPDVGSLVQQPLNIVAVLHLVELFKNLSTSQKHHLAQFIAWEFVPERQNITTQGDPGYSFIILREGGALITALDNAGRERPRSRLQPIAAFGKTSLLKGKLRDVTVRAVRGAEDASGQPGLAGADILVLDRRDLDYAVADKPAIWANAALVQDLKETEKAKPAFGWMQEGEDLSWNGRPHIFWLIWPLSLVGFALLAMIGLGLALPDGLNGPAGIALLLIACFILFPLAVGLVINYYDDYYAVTNRRVTRRDRQLLLAESRAEAPVEMIQDVTIQSNFWGRLFDYGDVSISTASNAKPIKLDHTPNPYLVKNILAEARTEAQAQNRGRQKEELRRGLIKDLRLALPIPPRQRALGNVPPPATSVVPPWFRRLFKRPRRERVPTPPNTRAWLASHSTSLPNSWRKVLFGPTPSVTPAKQLPGMIIWHKHWLNALGRVGPPFLMLFVLLVTGVLLLTGMIQIDLLNTWALFAAWSVLMAAAAIWFWWEYTDYRNDVYIVTDDRVIDIEMKPLGLSMKRREGGLEKVQNVVANQNGIWATIFGYGDVVISTAASDEGFTFSMVPKPQYVQSTVFQKLNRFRMLDEQRRASRRQQELVEALEVYHQLRGGGSPADGYPRQP